MCRGGTSSSGPKLWAQYRATRQRADGMGLWGPGVPAEFLATQSAPSRPPVPVQLRGAWV
eukprot:CAMPEP_0174291058 /NCGR_PEP_ID=MMETSP0809-20121228/30928_1 /TAXON_ID=73025 ORGANISM="Eutreptiella gymnastica-like, Strain CCMP1594" /NCGR_SAMPLE_ID=MMETSP0809 /ASSEMBLY_ACC=CAM_ASM_000658 /LENGTH=59 /DNA_ID=CAMNT_0015390177 /DNA_START=431 /DNA_END=610 /DNA_ORIENTATION=+